MRVCVGISWVPGPPYLGSALGVASATTCIIGVDHGRPYPPIRTGPAWWVMARSP
jgi:hypothetical protein